MIPRPGAVLLALAAAWPAAPVAAQQDQSVLFPLPEVEGALSWRDLAAAEVVVEEGSPRALVPEAVRARAGGIVKAVGFLQPLDAAGTRHLMTEMSPHCPFCVPVGREGMIVVDCVEPVGLIQRAVVLEGRFEVHEDLSDGMVYRISGAVLLDE